MTKGAHVDQFYGELKSAADIAYLQAIDATKWKPDASLLLEAMNEWPIVSGRSFFVGVTDGDVEAAQIGGSLQPCLCRRRPCAPRPFALGAISRKAQWRWSLVNLSPAKGPPRGPGGGYLRQANCGGRGIAFQNIRFNAIAQQHAAKDLRC